MDFRTVAVRNKANGLWHEAQQNLHTDVLLTPEACNLDDAERLETYPALPDWVEGDQMCARCYPVSSDR